jgi:hypothetical protein
LVSKGQHAVNRLSKWLSSLNELANGKSVNSGKISRKEAEYWMERYGANPNNVASYAKSFKGPITAVSLAPGTTIYRYTDRSGSQGSFYSPTTYPTSAAAVRGMNLDNDYTENNATIQQTWVAENYPVPALYGKVAGGTGYQYYVLEKTAIGLQGEQGMLGG